MLKGDVSRFQTSRRKLFRSNSAPMLSLKKSNERLRTFSLRNAAIL